MNLGSRRLPRNGGRRGPPDLGTKTEKPELRGGTRGGGVAVFPQIARMGQAKQSCCFRGGYGRRSRPRAAQSSRSASPRERFRLRFKPRTFFLF